MGFTALEQNMKALHPFYPSIERGAYLFKILTIQGLPVWIKGAVEIYELPLQEGLTGSLHLIRPKHELSFGQLTRIYKLLVEKLPSPVLFIADPLPPKFRPLLVKYRIPFIYKDESVFAPELGVIGKLKHFNVQPQIEVKKQKDTLAPFSLKIIAGLLTRQIEPEFSLKSLYEKMQQAHVKLSLSKLSQTLIELAEHEILSIHGSGPKKTYTTPDLQEMWKKVLELKFDPFFREMKTNYLLDSPSHIVAGESALSRYSNLSAPSETTVAMTARDFRKIYAARPKEVLNQELNRTFIVQTWKEDPRLFAVNGVLNQVEVYFSLKDHTDPRVQLSLDEMLQAQGLPFPWKENK